MKTADLTGPALDWAVAECEGLDYWRVDITPTRWTKDVFMPSTDWAQGGPIIERERIATRRHSNGKWFAMASSDLGDGEASKWTRFTFKDVPSSASTSRQCRFEGPTPLIAAMRCYIASKMGDEVDIPAELT